MRAMILAAGIGQRMGEMTKNTPKPLLKVGGRHLIEYSIDSLAKAGIREIVINVCYLKDQIMAVLGGGGRFGVDILYSEEEDRLETGGGVIKALPLLGPDPFIVMSSDIITDYPLQRLSQLPLDLAHLVLVKNPSYHLKGDYCIDEGHKIHIGSSNPFTFANIGMYRPALFTGYEATYLRLAHLWQEALTQGRITGECYQGLWYNIGTPQELQTANEALIRAREDSNL